MSCCYLLDLICCQIQLLFYIYFFFKNISCISLFLSSLLFFCIKIDRKINIFSSFSSCFSYIHTFFDYINRSINFLFLQSFKDTTIYFVLMSDFMGVFDFMILHKFKLVCDALKGADLFVFKICI